MTIVVGSMEAGRQACKHGAGAVAKCLPTETQVQGRGRDAN